MIVGLCGCDIKLACLGIKLFSATKQDCKEELDLWTRERIYGSRSAQKPGQILRARYLKRPVSRANSFLPSHCQSLRWKQHSRLRLRGKSEVGGKGEGEVGGRWPG